MNYGYDEAYIVYGHLIYAELVVQPANEIRILLVLFFRGIPGSIVIPKYVYNLMCSNI